MADKLARAKLAREAAALNRASGFSLPSLVFLTDDARASNPLAAIFELPRGSLVILRARDPWRRAALAKDVAPLARRRGLYWLIGDDPELGMKSGSHGVHFPEARLGDALRWRVRRPGWLITCAAHSLSGLSRAFRAGANAALLAPVFATQSHQGGGNLGLSRARLLARQSPVPVFALGGVDAAAAARLRGARLAGLAAIGGLLV